MAVHMQVVNVFGVPAYDPVTPQVVAPFQGKSVLVILEDLLEDAYVSLDGEHDHAHLVPGTPAAGIVFDQPVSKVWLRRGVVGITPTNVQVTITD